MILYKNKQTEKVWAELTMMKRPIPKDRNPRRYCCESFKTYKPRFASAVISNFGHIP